MGMETTYLKGLVYGLKGHMDNADDIEKIIINHSLAAAGAAVASGWMPGVGGAVATSIAFGFVCTMYYKICKENNIKIKKNILKAVASVVVAEVAAYLGVILTAEFALSFIPGLGNLGASVIAGIINFGMVYVAGVLFLKMMVNVFKANVAVEDLSEEEFKNIMKNISNKETIKKTYNESKSVHKQTKNSSDYSYGDIKPDQD